MDQSIYCYDGFKCKQNFTRLGLEEKTILLSKKFWNESQKILSENRTMVEAISENLQRKGTLTSEEVKNILKEIKN